MMGKPIKAFPYQDHQAHLTVHQSVMQDPKVMAAIGQNPNAKAMLAAMQAHIAEHVAYEYRRSIEQRMGVNLPKDGQNLPPHAEVELSERAAQAAQAQLHANVNEQKAAQNAAAQNDPVVQLQLRDMALKEREAAIKEKRLQVDSARFADAQNHKEQVDNAKMQLDGYVAGANVAQGQAEIDAKLKIAGMQGGVDIAKSRAEIEAELQKAGLQTGVDVAKSKTNAALTAAKIVNERRREDARLPPAPSAAELEAARQQPDKGEE
jgi:hypothetical protein